MTKVLWTGAALLALGAAMCALGGALWVIGRMLWAGTLMFQPTTAQLVVGYGIVSAGALGAVLLMVGFVLVVAGAIGKATERTDGQ